MSSSRHRAEAPALRARVGKLAVPVALATSVTGLVVSVGLANADSGRGLATVAADNAALKISVADLGDRKRPVSRTAPRVALEPEAVDKKFATADLNIWTRPTDKSKNVGIIDFGTKLLVTGKVVDGWVEILLKDTVRYVNADYVADEKPVGISAVAGVSGAPCPDGSSTESGLTAGAIQMYRAVCAAFPALSSYGGWDNHGEHSSGRAIDFMISDPALGKAVAEWLRAHAAELNLYNVIWAQHIYTQERGGEGWRYMSDRGSATANHYDHVHASVY